VTIAQTETRIALSYTKEVNREGAVCQIFAGHRNSTSRWHSRTVRTVRITGSFTCAIRSGSRKSRHGVAFGTTAAIAMRASCFKVSNLLHISPASEEAMSDCVWIVFESAGEDSDE